MLVKADDAIAILGGTSMLALAMCKPVAVPLAHHATHQWSWTENDGCRVRKDVVDWALLIGLDHRRVRAECATSCLRRGNGAYDVMGWNLKVSP